MLDKKDLDAIEKMFDKKFLEVEDRLDKKLDTKMDTKFEKFEEKINKMEEKLNKRFAVQDKKIDLLLEYSRDNLRKHDEYDRNFSRIDSKLLNHDLRLNSLEVRSSLVM